MPSTDVLLRAVDQGAFRQLFVEHLGWNNPDLPDREIEVASQTFRLQQVAGYKGLRIWLCAELPERKVQRAIDSALAKDNLERLVIFAAPHRQEWRWPRRAETGGVNPKLLVHQHEVGSNDPHLAAQLASIEVDFDIEPTLVELLARMRAAFDVQAEAASVIAARLMGALYNELEASDVTSNKATLLLARLLFLLFGDDSGMWQANLFDHFLRFNTSDESLHSDLTALFKVLDTPPSRRSPATPASLQEFRYVNGGLYEDTLDLPPLSPAFRAGLLKACDFDWAVISPAIFGSMFQTVKDKAARRSSGEFYTTEENILRTLDPLLLDDMRGRLATAWNDKGRLTRLHNDLGRLRVLDPACGCGNFLIVAYRELRALELDVLTRRRDLDVLSGVQTSDRSQLSLDVTDDVKVRLDHFYGIELEEWPARIAETAMLLVDHLANQRMEQEFGIAPDRLPIEISPTIVHGDALRVDWADVVTPSEDVVIVGNPPFIGQYTKTAQQTLDTRRIWGDRYNGYLDYVTCWYAKAIDYYGATKAKWAFVSTNSICQGEPVEYLWRPILQNGWRCRFAHRSFQWVTETPGSAAVHVSILGFDRESNSPVKLWTYPLGGRGAPQEQSVSRINPYLVPDASHTLIHSKTRPGNTVLPVADYGNKPTDGGNLLVPVAEYDSVASDAIASKYLRRFIGARELVHNKDRWCLWLEGATASEIRSSSVLRSRVNEVRKMREKSTKLATKEKAATPHLFDERRQPLTDYLAIPRHVGEHRPYFLAARYPSAVICSDANFMAADPDGLALGILSSSMYVAWMRAIGGRIKSDLRFSNTFTYNTFPLPPLSEADSVAISAAAKEIVRVRELYAPRSLASLYDPTAIPPALVAAHDALDKHIDKVFLYDGSSELERQQFLFRLYQNLNGRGW